MPCPYAEKKGPIVICKVTGKKVNPLAFPCLTNRYTRCKYYREAESKKAKPEVKPRAPIEQPSIAPPASVPSIKREETRASRTIEPVKETVHVKGRGEVKGLTLDGRKPRNCLECIYYGSKTKTCLLLGVTIKDPYDPPCAKG